MRLTVFGAAGEVTGSCLLVEASGSRILVDFGMLQGGRQSEARNRRIPRIRAGRLDAVILTHAHLDHSGRLPLLDELGFDGPIWSTPATLDIARIILQDAAHLQEEDARRESRRRARTGRSPLAPLFTQAEVTEALRRFKLLEYGQAREVAPGIRLTFHDAGHILGSATVDLEVDEGDNTRRLVISGDIGPQKQPFLPPPTRLEHADVVFLESTYGDRNHRDYDQTIDEFRHILQTAVSGGGKVLIPAFAVGRTQMLLYILREMAKEPWMKSTPVFLDSPMAIAATEAYREHRDLFDAETWANLKDGESPLRFPTLQLCPSARDSMALNDLRGPAIIIAGSGMCTGGRILHHLRHHLWKPTSHVVIAGFQGYGTLGRRLVEGADTVRIYGEPIRVAANVHTLGGFSAHAGQFELLDWLAPLTPDKPQVVLWHGEDKARETLAGLISQRFGLVPRRPAFGESWLVD